MTYFSLRLQVWEKTLAELVCGRYHLDVYLLGCGVSRFYTWPDNRARWEIFLAGKAVFLI